MLYELVNKFFGKHERSKDVAKKRLQFALMYDKLEVSDDTLVNLQSEIVKVISRYFEIDKDAIKLDISRSDDYSALVLKTPILSGKRRPPEVAQTH